MIKLKDILKEAKVKERSVPDFKSNEVKKLGLKQNQFKDSVFKKGFPPDKKFAMILIKKSGDVEVFTTNNNIKTAETALNVWQKNYAYKDEVKSWEIIPMKTVTI